MGKAPKATSKKKASQRKRAASSPREGALKSSGPRKVQVRAARGRPMLTWVGKRPLRHVTAFPAQLVEAFDPVGDAAERPGGLLFHGDNKEVLAHLLANGYRGKVDLVYIDPPFDSGADYVRRVSLRGAKGTAKLDGESYSLGEQIQYTDIWANDNYLQFMYERLQLLKELMAPNSTIVVHADSRKNAHLRLILDEIFGAESFSNEIIWWYWNKMQGNVNRFASNHDTLLCYRLGKPPFHRIREEREELTRQLKRAWNPKTHTLENVKDEKGNLVYIESEEKTIDDVWRISMLQPADQTENRRFRTQKPEDLLNLIIASATNRDALVLDCFVGSGTSVAVAQKMGRRWIGCDINKGAVQEASKEIQRIIGVQVADRGRGKQASWIEGDGGEVDGPAQLSFFVYRVNDYDLRVQHVEAVNLACEHIGIERRRADAYFDGTLGRNLVKVVPFNHPLTPLDLEEIRRELEGRPEEDRDVTVVCLGKDPASDAWIEDWNRLRRGSAAVNRIDVIELRTDPRYGKFFQHEPARARVRVSRKGERVRVEVRDFVSPTILERLHDQAGLLQPKIEDWRSMVDSIQIDWDYNGEVFRIGTCDLPARKNDLVEGRYEVPVQRCGQRVAVKVTDMLGEEVLVVEESPSA